MKQKEQLADWFADLVSTAENEPFVRHVLLRGAGEWVSVHDACAGLPRALAKLRAITADADSLPTAAWFPDPFAGEREGYCLLATYWEDVMACPVALYNRDRLLRDG